MNTIQRIPRERGLTNLIKRTRGDRTIIDRIKNRLIDTWLTNDYYILGRQYSMTELGILLGKTERYIQRRLVQQYMTDKNGLATIQDTEAMRRAMIFSALNGALGTRAKVLKQADLMVKEQHNKYTAFVSSEANKALTNLMKSDEQLARLAQLLMGTPSTQINVQQNSNIDQSTGDVITTSKAVVLIDEGREAQLLESPEAVNQLEAYHGHTDLPEVVAIYQADNPEATSHQKRSSYKASKHEKRREFNGTIVLPEDIEEATTTAPSQKWPKKKVR